MTDREHERRRRWRDALEVDLVPEQTSDDRDGPGWGDRPRTDKPAGAPDPDVQRYLDEKPPHH